MIVTRRFQEAMRELLSGYEIQEHEILNKTFASTRSTPVIEKSIEFVSLCEHHFLPFFGIVSIVYIPNEKLAGLSKLARIVDYYAHRLQLQERMTEQICDAIWRMLNPKRLIVRVEALHFCVFARGVKKRAKTITLTTRGFKNESAMLRTLQLLKARIK